MVQPVESVGSVQSIKYWCNKYACVSRKLVYHIFFRGFVYNICFLLFVSLCIILFCISKLNLNSILLGYKVKLLQWAVPLYKYVGIDSEQSHGDTNFFEDPKHNSSKSYGGWSWLGQSKSQFKHLVAYCTRWNTPLTLFQYIFSFHIRDSSWHLMSNLLGFDAYI